MRQFRSKRKLYIDGEELKSYEYVSEIRDAGIAAEPVKLGADEYFLLGDNPQGREDSRSSDIGIVKKMIFMEKYGSIPHQEIILEL